MDKGWGWLVVAQGATSITSEVSSSITTVSPPSTHKKRVCLPARPASYRIPRGVSDEETGSTSYEHHQQRPTNMKVVHKEPLQTAFITGNHENLNTAWRMLGSQ